MEGICINSNVQVCIKSLMICLAEQWAADILLLLTIALCPIPIPDYLNSI